MFLNFSIKRISTMTTLRRVYDEDAKTVGSLKRILRDDHRVVAASSALQASENAPIMPQLLEAALQEGISPPPRTESEETSEAISKRAESEERLSVRTWPTNSASWAR